MLTTIAPPTLVTGAPRVPLPYGLFSVFTLREGSSDRWEVGAQFETDTCDPTDGIGPWVCPISEVQTATVAGGPTTGTFTLTYAGQTTAVLAINASAAAVQTALENLSNLAPGDVTVTGPNGGPWVITFDDRLGNVALITAADTFDAGQVNVVQTTAGLFTNGLPKDLATNTGDVGEASEFTIYGHFACSPVGYSAADAQAKALAHLQAREEAQVEQAFWLGYLGNVPFITQGAFEINAGAKPGAVGIGMLEGFNATTYGSLGVIHMTRALAAYLLGAQVLEASNGRLRTKLGTPVVAGAGYLGSGPAGQLPSSTTSWAYVTPALFGYRSDVFDSSNRPGDLFDRGQNNLVAVAERNYLIGFDPCGVGAVLIDMTA